MAPLLLISFSILTLVWGQSKPLLLENANEMTGSQKKNTYELRGDVRLRHDSLKVLAHNAFWNTERQEISLQGNVRFFHPAGKLNANKGFYSTKTKLARGYGEVSMIDSAGLYRIDGDTILYYRGDHLLDIRKKAKMTLVDTAKNGKRDTLFLFAEKMLFYDDSEKAEAYDSVKLINKEFEIFCDSALLDHKGGRLKLWGNPVAKVRGYEITGGQIEGKLRNKKLEEMRIVSKAKAKKDPGAPKDSSETHLTEVEGDTLLASFSEGQISGLKASNQARGFFWEKKMPEFKNKGTGDLMVMEFEKGAPKKATLTGTARTFFHYLDKEKLVGINEAAGDTLILHFEGEELRKINIIGNRASGVFSGNKATKKDPDL